MRSLLDLQMQMSDRRRVWVLASWSGSELEMWSWGCRRFASAESVWGHVRAHGEWVQIKKEDQPEVQSRRSLVIQKSGELPLPVPLHAFILGMSASHQWRPTGCFWMGPQKKVNASKWPPVGFYLGWPCRWLCSPHSRMTLKPESYSCIKVLSPGSTQGTVLTFHSYPEQRRADKGCSGGKLKAQDGGCPLLASSSAVPEVFLRVSFSRLSLPSPSLSAPMRHRGPECPVSSRVLWAPLAHSHSFMGTFEVLLCVPWRFPGYTEQLVPSEAHHMTWTSVRIVCIHICFLNKENIEGDFPGGPVVKTLPFNSENVGLIPYWWTKIPHNIGQLSPRTTMKT